MISISRPCSESILNRKVKKMSGSIEISQENIREANKIYLDGDRITVTDVTGGQFTLGLSEISDDLMRRMALKSVVQILRTSTNAGKTIARIKANKFGRDNRQREPSEIERAVLHVRAERAKKEGKEYNDYETLLAFRRLKPAQKQEVAATMEVVHALAKIRDRNATDPVDF